MRKNSILIFLFTLVALVSNAQTQFWSDDFEDAGSPSSGSRTPSSAFYATTERYFNAVTTAQINWTTAISGVVGSKFWGGADIDNITGQNTQSHHQNVTWSSINISGKTGLSFSGLFAIGNLASFDHFPGSSPIDYMLVEYRIDGGAWNSVVRFFPNIANSGSGSLAIETTGDSLAQGEGAALSGTFTQFSANIVGTGTLLDLRFKCLNNGTSFEEVGGDNFRLFETISAPEINLQGNAVSIVDGDATPSATDHTDFGSQSICSGTIVRTFTVQNTGTSNLTVNTPTLSGTNAADFSITSNPGSPVAASGSTTFQVTFNPSASGTRTASVTVTNNDANEGTYDFAIQGTGVDPEVNLQGNGNSISDGDATPSVTDHSDFGSQSICSGTIVRTFTIQNTGTSNLTLANPTLSGTNAADFSVTANPSTPVSAAGSTTFQVTFNPSASGTRSATVTFTNNDCDEATYDFAIQGTGIDPEVNVQGNGNSISDGDATPSATDHSDFGSQDMCSGTIVRTFTIQNTGNSNLTLANPTLSGTNAADFSVSANPSTPVSAAGSTTFDVTFNPSASGTRTATISFTSDDCDEATYNFDIQGTGIDGTPNADAPSNVTACDSYTLPALTIGNYFTGTGGTGTALSAGINITSTQTIYVYAVNGSCTDENNFVVTINTTPTADAPSNVTACDSYTLPALTIGNYFTGTGGTGTALSAGNNITSTQTIYVYAETGTTPNCTDENSFLVTINTTPTADAPSNVTACDSYTLPALTIGNYFTGTGGTGTALSAGNNITSTQTIYVFAETGTTPNCTDENSFVVTINNAPVADDPADVTTCDSYTLPALTVGNYFTGTGGTGTALSAGNNITSTQTIYVFAETGTTPNCTDENSFVVTINYTPVADDPADVTTCDSYTLPALTIGNYFTGTGGTGTALSAGNNITSTQTIYVFAETGTTPNCTDENSFVVTINNTPVADDPADVTTCDSYTLPALTVGNYFTGAGGTGTALSAGNNITSTQTVYVYAETGTTPNCTDENSFVVTINTTPTISGNTPSARCGTGTVDLGATASAGIVNWYDASSGGTLVGTGTTLTTPSISATTTYYAEANNSACLSASRTTVAATIYNNCTKTYITLCGTRYENIGTAVVAYSVPGATMYKFEVVNGGTTQYIERSDRWFYFTQLGTWAYNTDYTIRVAAQVSGVYTAFGDACVVSTPYERKIYTNLCGSTMTNINTAITAYTVPGAVKYKFELVNGGTTQYIERTERWFYFTQLGSYLYDTPYTIRVASSSDGTNFSAYGPTCVITTPAEKRIYANLCGATLASMNSAVTAYQVAGAVKYKFKVVNGGNTQYIERTSRWFYFTQLGSFSYNTVYDVSVAISTDGTNFSTYGPVCVITTPASGMAKPNDNELELFTDFSLETYPNPNDGNFTISSTHEGQFNIINELGQLIQKVEITKENNFETKVEGLENGVYFITGTINDEIVTKKVMVLR